MTRERLLYLPRKKGGKELLSVEGEKARRHVLTRGRGVMRLSVFEKKGPFSLEKGKKKPVRPLEGGRATSHR